MSEVQKPMPNWPGWTYRLDAHWIMHDKYPLAIYMNDSRTVGYKWELWKCMDFNVVSNDDLFLGFYPSCELAMDAMEGWALVFFSSFKPLLPPPSRMKRLGRLIRKTIERIRY